MKRKQYPRSLKKLANIYDRVFPVYSERLFKDVMGWWFFRSYRFKHQGLVGPWRPDFVSYKNKLVIEIDGAGKVPKEFHAQQKYYDMVERRDDDLYRRGYSVMHVTFKDIRDNPVGVRVMVKKWAKAPHKFRREAQREHVWWRRLGW